MNELGESPREFRHLTQNGYSIRWDPEEVVADFFVAPLDPLRTLNLLSACVGFLGLVAYRANRGVLFELPGSDDAWEAGTWIVFVLINVLSALYLSRRHEVRLGSRGPLRVTTFRRLGAPVRREYPRGTLPVIREEGAYWHLRFERLEGSVNLASGATPLFQHRRADFAALKLLLEQIASRSEAP